MANEDLPPLEFDGKFDGYGYFDPRAFWEKVVQSEHDRIPSQSPSDRIALSKDWPRN